MSNSTLLYIFKGHSGCWTEMSWSQTKAEARHSTIAAGKREQMVVWTKVVAAEIKKKVKEFIYIWR